MRVIAVAGISGVGKTQIVRRVAELLGDAPTLHFDDYAALSTFPSDLRAWLEAGADPNVFQTPAFARDLHALREGKPVSSPTGRVVEPGQVILIEEPFGRMRIEMAPLIDFAVLLDAPFDVLLARRLVRRFEEEREQIGDQLDHLMEVVRADLDHHLDLGWRLHIHAQRALAANADAVLDSTRPIDEVARALIQVALAGE
jgi:uridine kinase